MWNQLLKIGQSAVNETKWGLKQLEATRHSIFGTAGEDDWETQLPRKLQQISEQTPLGIAEKQAVSTAQSLAEKIGIDPTIAGLVVGAVMPGPNGKPRSIRKVAPATAKKMSMRDNLVRTNTPPTRAQFPRNADYRGIAGDVQGGVEGQPLRMENRPAYRQAQTGKAKPTTKDLNNFTPHHRMGIQDQQAFTAGLTPEQLKIRRSKLDEGGLFMGNRGENYEGLYDGKLSAKSRPKTGVDSADHFDVHDLSDKMRDRLGIRKGVDKNGRVDRTLDTMNGKPIKDMSEDQAFAVQAQLALRDELIIDKVQLARFRKLQEKFGHLSPAERRKIIENNPKAFANFSTKVQ